MRDTEVGLYLSEIDWKRNTISLAARISRTVDNGEVLVLFLRLTKQFSHL